MKEIVYGYFKMAIVIWLATIIFPGAISASTNGILIVSGLMVLATVALGIILGIVTITRKRIVKSKQIMVATILTYIYTLICDVIIMNIYDNYSDSLNINGMLPLIILSVVIFTTQLEWPNSNKKKTRRHRRTVRFTI